MSNLIKILSYLFSAPLSEFCFKYSALDNNFIIIIIIIIIIITIIVIIIVVFIIIIVKPKCQKDWIRH